MKTCQHHFNDGRSGYNLIKYVTATLCKNTLKNYSFIEYWQVYAMLYQQLSLKQWAADMQEG